MDTLTNLTDRLDCLERQNRRLKRGFYGFAFIAALLVLVAGAATDQSDDVAFRTVEAQKIAIVDRDGKERLVLELEAGEPTLTMLNHDGMQQVYLGINENWNDSAYLSVSSRLENGAVDKQAVLVATTTRGGGTAFQRQVLPGNAQLVLYDRAPKQQAASDRHLLRLSTGWRDALKPYLEVREVAEARDRQLTFDALMAQPADTGQRFLLDTTPETVAVYGIEGIGH